MLSAGSQIKTPLPNGLGCGQLHPFYLGLMAFPQQHPVSAHLTFRLPTHPAITSPHNQPYISSNITAVHRGQTRPKEAELNILLQSRPENPTRTSDHCNVLVSGRGPASMAQKNLRPWGNNTINLATNMPHLAVQLH